jgi:PAS domain S-box-containing protein
MSSVAQLLSFFILICTVPIAGLAAYAFQNRQEPGVRGFLFCLVGMVGWSVQIALITWPTQIIPVHVNTTIRYVFQILVVFGWPLLVWEYSNQKRFSLKRSRVAALLVIPVLTILLTATTPWHHLVLAAETPPNPAGISEFALGPWYLVYMGFAVTLVILPVGILASDLRIAHGNHRKQLLLLLIGWFVGFPGALHIFLFRAIEPIPLYVDLTPLAFVLTAGLWGMALFRYHLFSMVPVSRRTAVETMPDPVISVDSNQIVVDANPKAQQLFSSTGNVGGTTLETFCELHPQILSLYEESEAHTTEVTLSTDTGPRHFSAHIRPIEQGGSVTGSLIVLREITQLREHEQELDLLKQVLSRVFRHNMRNRLNVIEGHTQALAEQADGSHGDKHATTIFKNVDQLLAHSEKAVDMQKIIDAAATDTTVALGAVARRQVTSFQKSHPEIEIIVDCSDGIGVRCHPDIDKAVQELLENAIHHYDGPTEECTLRVTVSRRDQLGFVCIEDNGSGIAPHEVDALNAGRETDLQHGSGVGLWVVRLLVEKSGGTLTIDDQTELGGTRVELALPIPQSDDAYAQRST